jgi:hypothetical protein
MSMIYVQIRHTIMTWKKAVNPVVKGTGWTRSRGINPPRKPARFTPRLFLQRAQVIANSRSRSINNEEAWTSGSRQVWLEKFSIGFKIRA